MLSLRQRSLDSRIYQRTEIELRKRKQTFVRQRLFCEVSKIK